MASRPSTWRTRPRPLVTLVLMRTHQKGRCHICGENGDLTKEHVIPSSAGNRGRLRVNTLASVKSGWRHGELFGNGLIRSTLCARCNSLCGSYYVPSFALWTAKAAEYRAKLNNNIGPVLLPFAVNRLMIAKQLAVMTLAMAGADSIDLPHYQRLRKFVLAPKCRMILRDFTFYTYFHFGPPAFEGVFAAVSMTGGPSPSVYCHVGIEPLGYTVIGNDAVSVEWAQKLGMLNISYFSNCDRLHISVDHLQMPLLSGAIPLRASRGDSARDAILNDE